MTQLTDDQATHQGTMRFLHLYLACHLLTETRFEAAESHFHKGKIDPRLLVRLFTRLRGKVIGSAEEIEVYQGLEDILVDMPSIDDISRSAKMTLTALGLMRSQSPLRSSAITRLTCSLTLRMPPRPSS